MWVDAACRPQWVVRTMVVHLAVDQATSVIGGSIPSRPTTARCGLTNRVCRDGCKRCTGVAGARRAETRKAEFESRVCQRREQPTRSCRGVWPSPPPCQGGNRGFKSRLDRSDLALGREAVSLGT
jgi:hypothetical protein